MEKEAEEDQAAESAPADAEDTAVDELEWPPQPLVQTGWRQLKPGEAFGPMVAADPQHETSIAPGERHWYRWWQVDLVDPKGVFPKIHGNQ